ncbi:zinc-alpha-2-glycoprotein isoform X2 [Carassius gibelio]|uniref:zinc-alpha-2-glycoprotein isoform X2 n=1 Tax=Carassius gibelio TaxID=101364 RepID=UPI002277FDC1|nr:zinc-alpha-2-glycoprotein isoform X2 [Carassius gibelio]
MFLCFVLMFVLLYLGDAQQEDHYLHFKFTALSKADTFPEFSAVAVADDRQIKHYSNEERDWILTADNWINPPEEPPDSRDWFLHQLKSLSNCTDSQCFEPHVLQRVIGCELEKSPEGTVSLRAFDEYGFDGEDFMSFDSDTQQWIEKNPKAKETKIKWDQQTGRNKLLHHYLKTCTDWISSFNNTKKNSPDVGLFVKKAPDDHSKLVLICLVTGFYPRDIEMNIRLNRINIQNQISSGVRPNDDETFQMRSSVKIDRNHRGSYDCHVIHSSLTEPVSVNWDGTCIDCEKGVLWFVIAGLAVLVLVLVLAVIGYCIYKKKKSNDYRYGCDDGVERNMITPV